MDTTVINILSDKSTIVEIIKMIISGILIFIAAYLAFKYGLKKERIINEEKETNRLDKLKYFINFSIAELIKSSEKQLEYINEFKKQFKSDVLDIEPIHLSSTFDSDNLNWISSLDFYEIFINMSRRHMDEKSRAFGNLKFCLKVTKQVSNNLESVMNKYRTRVNELGDKYNKISSEIRNEINELIKKDNNREFINDFNSLREQKHKKDKLTDFSYMYNEFYMPLLNLSEKHKMFSLIQIIPELKNINLQIQGLKSQYYGIYNNFSEQLCESITELKKLKTFHEGE